MNCAQYDSQNGLFKRPIIHRAPRHVGHSMAPILLVVVGSFHPGRPKAADLEKPLVPISVEALTELRKSQAAYEARFKTYRMRYESRSRDFSGRDARPRRKGAEPEQRVEPRISEEKKPLFDREAVFKNRGPIAAGTVTIRTLVVDEANYSQLEVSRSHERESETIDFQGPDVGGRISATNRDAYLQTADWHPAVPSPFWAVGIVVLNSDKSRLSSLLVPEAHVYDLGADVIDGMNVRSIQIGPAIPDDIRPPGISNKESLRISFAPDLANIPVRVARHAPNLTKLFGHPIIVEFRNQDFQRINDRKASDGPYFPFTIALMAQEFYVELCIKEFELNPEIDKTLFDPLVPADFSLRIDKQHRFLPGLDVEASVAVKTATRTRPR